MLIGNNTQDKFSKQVYVQDEFNSDRAINEVVTYFAPIRFGNWTSEVSAKIETTFFSDSIPKFIRFVAGGYEWNANSSSWLYYAMLVKCESFSSSSCKVSYKGYWMIPLTGVVDTNYVTYNITYNPY